jgi:NAD(P)-dependent dehydrogenase (short-subunit alcohol dehydrogenase family)
MSNVQYEPDGVGPRRLGAVVVGGVGEGLGFALSARFAAAGHPVVMLARSPDRLAAFAGRIADRGGIAQGRQADVRDEVQITQIFQDAAGEHGTIDAAIFNAGANHRKPMLEITGDTFEKVWRLACFGAFIFGREAVRHMLPRGRGTVLFTGATASMRGGPQFAAFAAAKFGTRAIAQSMAREFGPQGIHVASVIIDGGIDMPAIHRRYAAAGKTVVPDGLLSPDAIAETYYQIHRQHRSAWTMETEVRPYCETF